jgi:hypothetical protein
MGAVVSLIEAVCSNNQSLTDDIQVFRASEEVLYTLVNCTVTVIMAIADAVIAFFQALANCLTH